jgi:glyoxylase I family protein
MAPPETVPSAGIRPSGATMSELSGFHHVALTVTDLDRSAAWYCRVLGLVELFREAGDDRRAVVCGFPGGGHAVGLVWHAATAGSFDPRRVGLDHFSFVVRRRQDLEAWAQRLDGEHVSHSGVVEVPPGAILNFKDPDGIAVAIFWDR